VSILDKLSKGVGKAADQAKFEAEKRLRMNRLNDEIAKLASDLDQAALAIGKKAIKLRVAELEDLIQGAEAIEAQIAAKKAELEKAKAEEFKEP
jgi:hypothetical protein